MIGLLIVTHGRLAEELKAAALIIQPDIQQIVAVALDHPRSPLSPAAAADIPSSARRSEAT